MARKFNRQAGLVNTSKANSDRFIQGVTVIASHSSLVEDLEGQSRRIVEHCGLDWDDRCLDFHKTERAVHTPSAEQVRQPVYKSGVEQWKHFEEFLEPLRRALQLEENSMNARN